MQMRLRYSFLLPYSKFRRYSLILYFAADIDR